MKKIDIEKEIYDSSDEFLIEFIRKNFELNDTIDKHNYHRRVDTLEKLNNRAINTGLARMERIKNDNDISWLQIFITLIVFMFTIMGSYFKDDLILISPKYGLLIGLSIILTGVFLIAYSLSKTVKKTGHNKMTAYYFSALLKGIKEDKKI